MLKNLKGIKRYQDKKLKRLPAPYLKGAIQDIKMHLRNTPSNERHIFVLGAPRSGTTLIRGVLAGHSSISTTDEETYFFCRRRVSLFDQRETRCINDRIHSAPSKVAAFDELASFIKKRDNAEIFLEKTPEHAILLDNLLYWYPKSDFIFVVRDGRDAYSSSFRNPGFHARSGKSFPYIWRDTARIMLQHQKSERLHTVRYEDFVRRPECETRKVMKKIGLYFEETQLHSATFSQTSLRQHKGHEKLNEEINDNSIGIFRKRLTQDQVKHFQSIAGSELRALGYTE